MPVVMLLSGRSGRAV